MENDIVKKLEDLRMYLKIEISVVKTEEHNTFNDFLLSLTDRMR